MELWRELLISGLQNEGEKFEFINDKILKDVLENKSYKVLLEIKDTIENLNLSDEECFIKIEKIIAILEKNNVLCDRHDFG